MTSQSVIIMFLYVSSSCDALWNWFTKLFDWKCDILLTRDPCCIMRTQAFIVYDTFRQRSITSELMTESSVCWAWSRRRVRSFLLEAIVLEMPRVVRQNRGHSCQWFDFQSESSVELKWLNFPEHKGWRANAPLSDIITQIHDAVP